jgi:hypothetical protein
VESLVEFFLSDKSIQESTVGDVVLETVVGHIACSVRRRNGGFCIMTEIFHMGLPQETVVKSERFFTDITEIAEIHPPHVDSGRLVVPVKGKQGLPGEFFSENIILTFWKRKNQSFHVQMAIIHTGATKMTKSAMFVSGPIDLYQGLTARFALKHSRGKHIEYLHADPLSMQCFDENRRDEFKIPAKVRDLKDCRPAFNRVV